MAVVDEDGASETESLDLAQEFANLAVRTDSSDEEPPNLDLRDDDSSEDEVTITHRTEYHANMHDADLASSDSEAEFRHRRHRGPDTQDPDTAEVPLFSFGEFSGQSFKTITEEEAHYFFWAESQTRPSALLKQYVNWVTDNYDINFDKRKLSRNTDGQAFDADWEEVYLSHRFKAKEPSKTEKIFRAKQAQVAKCTTCGPFSRAGTNAHQTVMTCTVCGFREKERKDAPIRTRCPGL